MTSKLKKRNTIVLTLVSLLIVFISANAQAVTWRVGSNCPVDSPTDTALKKLAETLAEKSNNKLELKVFPANMLGGNNEMMEMVKTGALEIQVSGASMTAVLGVPEYNILKIPYVVDSYEHLYRVYDSDLGKKLKADTLAKGVRILDAKWNRMHRHVSSNVPIWGLDGLQGFKIRTGDRGSVEGFKLLGAAPVNIPLNEMYLALKQKVADGANLPLDYFFDHSIYEANEYLIMTSHTIETQEVRVNEKAFAALSDELKTILVDAVKEYGEYNNKLTFGQEEEYITKLQNAGMKIIVPNKNQIKKAIMDNSDKINDIYPNAEKDFFLKIQEYR